MSSPVNNILDSDTFIWKAFLKTMYHSSDEVGILR